MASLSIETVSKHFGSTHVLRGVSLEIQSGEFFSLLGPSGCGKSTLLRIIAGLEHADSGSIHVSGRLVDQVAPQRRGIGMVFQQYALWPHMTVGQNVRFGLEGVDLSSPERNARMLRALERVQMEGYVQRYPHELSGGQQQRVALARALAMQPGIILLDEPLSNLDARLRVEIRQELIELHDTLGTTMVYVTHDQEDALALSSRVAIIHEGAIQQVGTPREIYKQPSSPFVAKFIGDANLIPCQIQAHESGTDVLVKLKMPNSVIISAPVTPAARMSQTLGFLCVRPSNLKVSSALEVTAAAAFPATIKRITYRGADYLVEFEAIGELSLRASVPERQLPSDSRVGNSVFLSWRHEDCVFIPDT